MVAHEANGGVRALGETVLARTFEQHARLLKAAQSHQDRAERGAGVLEVRHPREHSAAGRVSEGERPLEQAGSHLPRHHLSAHEVHERHYRRLLVAGTLAGVERCAKVPKGRLRPFGPEVFSEQGMNACPRHVVVADLGQGLLGQFD